MQPAIPTTPSRTSTNSAGYIRIEGWLQNSLPVFDDVVPLDERKRAVELSDEDKPYDYT